MRLKALLIIFSFMAISCASLPVKPQVTLCVADFKSKDMECGQTGSDADPLSAGVENLTGKMILITPSDWSKIQTYIDQLVDTISNE